MKKAGLRVVVDDSDRNPGFKFNAWELKGTPLRLELGPKDFEKGEVRAAIRHSNEKFQVKWDNIADEMVDLMPKIHKQMYDKAVQAREDNMATVDNWADFMKELGNRKIVLADWCDTVACEEKVKETSKEESMQAMEEMNEEESKLTGAAKTLCIPYTMGKQAQKKGKGKDPFKNAKCFMNCGKKATVTALWGRSY